MTILRFVVAIGIFLAPVGAAAEIRLELRDGVLYVWNTERPLAIAAPRPADTKMGQSVTRTTAPYGDVIRAAAARYGLEPELVESVVRAESNFNARAVSPKGARGLMQLMPTTAAQLGVRDVFDVRQNIEGGVRHLRYLVDHYRGNLTLALAAYNAGMDAVTRHGGVPPYEETRAYVARVLRLLQHARSSAGAQTAAPWESPAAGTLHRYEAVDGHVVYSNLPIDKLSAPMREALLGRP